MTDITYSLIPELNLLKEFDESPAGRYGFADGFEFYTYDRRDAGLVEWLGLDQEKPFLDRLIPFAQATGSGSFYALWRCDDREDLATLPVVFFGDEGDLDVVARGLRELFQLLALDDEWYLHKDEEEDEEPSAGHEEYLAWLERHFGLAAPEDADVILEAAGDEYGARFLRWLIPHVPEDIAETLREDLSAFE
ncbi:hypothetical protein OG453_09645 [Streptomyces sp. NBC_01381]|uniref:hypothetical protein n=1 Tax=Streptomyces sp. NBC_01381 TaxID=2903845 RepID=UPI00225B1A47|nr:hypothetical protein [Streptomyces sp. NBC_01381]MCX4666926.1 hypothetical protein [Streptomyces sp. NBC_01381]